MFCMFFPWSLLLLWDSLQNRRISQASVIQKCTHETSIYLKRKKIFQKEKHHSSVFWKAFQISTSYFSLHRHFKWNQHSCSHTFMWNQHFWGYALHEMNSSLICKWNQHPCCHALMRKEHFNPFRPEIDVFAHSHCVKWSLLVRRGYAERSEA